MALQSKMVVLLLVLLAPALEAAFWNRMQHGISEAGSGLQSGISEVGSSLVKLAEIPVSLKQKWFRDNVLPTLWCGYRDAAPYPEAVSAIYPRLDACCRDHDNCPMIVDRGQCFKGICNKSPVFPILDCKCERKFMECLMASPNLRSLPYLPISTTERLIMDTVGYAYFDLAPRFSSRTCIEKTFPVVGCKSKMKVIISKSKKKQRICQDPLFNKSLPKKWQLFALTQGHGKWFTMSSYVKEVSTPMEKSYQTISQTFEKTSQDMSNYLDRTGLQRNLESFGYFTQYNTISTKP